ncbi:IncF plasmid conjugative transfer pilus assembly protein TraL [Alteromonas mediterranea UM7]|nr:IncF plasmid conjugative transfer pilus assembly protein TraL [Alteromonas mediterranea UM7]
MEPVNIPSYIDDPPHFLLWSADEMAPILLGLVIGIFTGNALVLCLLGLVQPSSIGVFVMVAQMVLFFTPSTGPDCCQPKPRRSLTHLSGAICREVRRVFKIMARHAIREPMATVSDCSAGAI